MGLKDSAAWFSVFKCDLGFLCMYTFLVSLSNGFITLPSRVGLTLSYVFFYLKACVLRVIQLFFASLLLSFLYHMVSFVCIKEQNPFCKSFFYLQAFAYSCFCSLIPSSCIYLLLQSYSFTYLIRSTNMFYMPPGYQAMSQALEIHQ